MNDAGLPGWRDVNVAVAEEKFTRCPGCRTVFRVTPAQLALRDGQVRCGHCRTVFDGTANLIRLAPGAPMPAGDES
ncbi:MAG TPA: MJ0042-type zinc finger domain-containing protein, partial [Casimicrobiaceae bacterium]